MPIFPRAVRFPAVFFAAALIACGAAPKPPEAPVTPAAPEVAPEPEAGSYAVLEVTSATPTEILLDGTSIGKTPIQGYRVAPGSHDVTFVDDANGNRTMAVKLEPGDSKVVESSPVPVASGALVPEPTKAKTK